MRRRSTLFGLGATALLAIGAAGPVAAAAPDARAGAVYTLSNLAAGNSVIAFSRSSRRGAEPARHVSDGRSRRRGRPRIRRLHRPQPRWAHPARRRRRQRHDHLVPGRGDAADSPGRTGSPPAATTRSASPSTATWRTPSMTAAPATSRASASTGNGHLDSDRGLRRARSATPGRDRPRSRSRRMAGPSS